MTDVDSPSLLLLDSFCLVHIAQFLTSPRDLVSLQRTCRTLHGLLQANSVWANILKLNYGGFQLQLVPSVAKGGTSSAPAAVGPFRLPSFKYLCRLLQQSSQDLHPVRFVAIYTDGGVDTGTLHYWADHAFIPNSWAPFCAKYADNVNLLAILKTGPDATGELSHRSLMINCLKWVLPLLQHHPMPSHPETHPIDPTNLNEAAEMLSAWKTQRLESFFCQMAARATARDPLGLSMLRGLPAGARLPVPAEARTAEPQAHQQAADPGANSLEERRETARVLGQDILMRTWYERAYRLKFIQQQPTAGTSKSTGRGLLQPGARERVGGNAGGSTAGGRPTDVPWYDSPYVLDEMALRSDLLTPEAASSIAILQGLAVSREGRLSCPVQSGALLAGLLPQDWPQGGLVATAPQHNTGSPPVLSYDELMRAILEQPSVRALNDKLDAESVFAACASGQLPPWVRHVVMEHAEYIELLPQHLAEEKGPQRQAAVQAEAGGSSGSGSTDSAAAGGAVSSSTLGNGGLPMLHPVIWFRFTDHAEYSRRRLSSRARTLLRHVAELCGDAAELLEDGADQLINVLRAELAAWSGTRPCATAAAAEAAPSAGRPEGDLHATEAAAAAAASTSAGTSTVACAASGGDQDPVSVTMDLGGSTGAEGSAGPSAATTVAPVALPGRSLRPNSLSMALHRVVRLAERLTSLGTAVTILAPELREAAGFSVPESDVHGLLEQGTAMKDTLNCVARQLASLEELSRAVNNQQARPRRSAQRGNVRYNGGWEDMGREEEMELEADAEEESAEDSSKDEQEMEEDSTKDMATERAGSGGSTWLPSGSLGDVTASSAAPMGPAGEGAVLPTAGQCPGVELWLEAALRLEREGLWDALEGEVLGADGRRSRRALAMALRRSQAAALTAAEVQAAVPDVVERRNEDLLRRLRVEVPQLASAEKRAEAGEAAAPRLEPPAKVNPAAVAAVPVLEPPPPEGWAADRLFDPQLQHDVDTGRVALPEADEDGHRVMHLAARLLFPVAANAVVFKAIRPENLMDMVGWDENEKPNVDVQYVGLQGRVVRLPPGVQAVPGL